MKRSLLLMLLGLVFFAAGPKEDEAMLRKIFDAELTQGKAYENLRQLCKVVGHRLTGSHGDSMAVFWGQRKMKELGYSNIRLQSYEANYWLRGKDMEATILTEKEPQKLHILALGGSVATPSMGLTAPVVEVNSWEELTRDNNDIKGKIVFYNRPMDPKNINTFKSYGEAVDQRHKGAMEAAKVGAVAAIVRSPTLAIDQNPHTGSLGYEEGVDKIPGVCVSTADAELLHNMLSQFPDLKVMLKTDCKNAGKVMANNVVGEIKGSMYPDKYIVVGGHLDSWDVGEGAHDDGAGIVQALEVLNIFKAIGYQPKHTIRCVLFGNEENGVGGGLEYAKVAKEKKEKHIAAIESDAGGFSPRGFHVDGVEGKGEYGLQKLRQWSAQLEPYNLHYFAKSYAGTDIGPLRQEGAVIFGLIPDSQRYFDYHHTKADVFEAVNKRELELGAASMAALVYLIDQDGLQK